LISTINNQAEQPMRSPENPPHPFAGRRRAARSLLPTATLAMILAVGGVSIAQDEAEDQGVVANVLSRLLTTPTTRISIGGVEGVLSTSAVIRDIAIADPQGVWLTLDRAEINWSFTALLRGRLQVSELTLDELVITRRPLPTDQPEAVAEGPVFPELPVELIVESFNLARLVLEEPVLGTHSSSRRRRVCSSISTRSAWMLRGPSPSPCAMCPIPTC